MHIPQHTITINDKCFISYLSEPDAPVESRFYNKEEMDNFFRMLPIKLDGNYENTQWLALDSISNYISNAYVIAIFETNSNIYEDYCQISEKTFKGILAEMPFMIFTTRPGILQYLRSLGFKTFSPMIDESCDSHYDYERRYELFIRAIEDICKKTSMEIMDLYEKYIPIVTHNTRVLKKSNRHF